MKDFCSLCWGLGEVIREDKHRNNRLFCWPCPFDCPSSATLSIIRTTVSPEHAIKMARKMRQKAGPARG